MRKQQKSTLSELRSEYDKGSIDRKVFEGLIFKYLIDNGKKYSLFNGHPDRWFDFISWLYPRLSRAIDYYRDTSSSFDSYINSIIHWSGKEYKSIEERRRITEYICWKSKTMEVKSCEPFYAQEHEHVNENDTEYEQKLNLPLALFSSRQILILFLKAYYFMDENLLSRVAKTTKINIEHLRVLLDMVRRKRLERDIKINTLKENLHSQYHRCLAFQSRLSEACPGTAKYYKLKNYLERARRRYVFMKKRFNNIRLEATNRQVSEVLHIPKGTVDSTLYNAKRKWDSFNMQICNQELV